MGQVRLIHQAPLDTLNIQPDTGGKVKPYQPCQLVNLVEAYRLELGEQGSMEQCYHINVFWSDEDGCWIADVPDLRYCSAHGETPEAALREIQVAMRAWLEVQREEGRQVPEPRYRPAIYAGQRAA